MWYNLQVYRFLSWNIIKLTITSLCYLVIITFIIIFGRLKIGDMGVQQAEPRLEPKKHRRQSRKRINQSILDEMDDDDDNMLDEENDPILRALKNENS